MPDLDQIKQGEEGVRDGARAVLQRPVGQSRRPAARLPRPRQPRCPAIQGAVTRREAMQFGRVIEAYVRAVEATEFERRSRALEAADPAPT